MRYLPKSPADRQGLLRAIGIHSVDELFAPIPAEYRLKRDLELAPGMAEADILDWYQQRADATEDPQLREILEHNRDEEKEHAMMLLEWIRRHDVAFARMMKLHTGHAGPIVSEEVQAEASGSMRAQGQPDEAAKDVEHRASKRGDR